MKVFAPIGGVVEWRVEPGAAVIAGQPLAWIAGPGRCGLIAIAAPSAGTLTWRRHVSLETVYQGELCALVDGDAPELDACREAERDAASRAVTELRAEHARLIAEEGTRPLAAALLGPQRVGIEARLSTLEPLLVGSSR